MALEKQFPISVIYETKTEEEWLAVEKENGGIYIIPEGRPIIYKYPNGNGYYHRMKIGDGVSTISQLSFNIEEGANISTISKFDNMQTVPSGVGKYAELTELGGMTYKVEELVGGTVVAGPYTFSGSSVTIPASDALASSFSYVIYLKNSGSSSIDAKLLLSTGAVLSTGITLPADGQFHAYTGDYSSDVSAGFILYAYGSDLVPSENVEASTITFYAPGAVPSSQTVLKSAAVTAIESASYNILDLTPALNNRLIDNGDGTYTLRKVNGERFSEFFPIYIPKGQRVFCYLEIVSTNIDGLTRIPLQLFGADKKDNRSSIGLSNGGQAFAPMADTFFAKAYLQNNDAEGAYVTFRNPMIKYGKSAEFSAYAKHTLPIPAEVQALDGYGLGIGADCHNYIDWGKKQYRQEVIKIRIDGSETWSRSSATHIFQACCKLSQIAGDTQKFPAIISNGYDFYYWMDPAKERPFFRITKNGDQLWIEETVDAYANVDEWKAYLAEHPVEIVYPLATPIITDISSIISNNIIPVEAGGTLTFVNENNYDVPTTVTYYIADNTEAKYAGEFIGDLVGTASSAVCDSEGNNIAGTYVTKEYVDSKVNESSGTIVTTDGVAVDTWDTNTKRNRITTGYRVYETDGNGNDSIGTWAQGSADGNTYVKRLPNGNIVTALVPVNNNDAASKKYVDDLAATKVTIPPTSDMTNNINYVFGTLDQGQTIVPYKVTDGNAAWAIARRGANATLSVGTPTADEHAATKKYVDNALANKVAKITSTNKLYATDSSGAETTVDYSYEATPFHVVQRGLYGNITVADTPVNGADAINKNYVDNAVQTAAQDLADYVDDQIASVGGTGEASFIVLKSPNGSRFKVTVNDNGQLSTTKL